MSVIDLTVVPGEMSGGSIHRFKKRIQRWRLLNPKRLLAWSRHQNSFLASGFTSWLCGPLNMCNSVSPADCDRLLISFVGSKFYKYKPPHGSYGTNRAITDRVCISTCPVNSFRAVRSFLAVIPRVATGKAW